MVVEVYLDDSFADIMLRLHEKSQQMMIEALDKIKEGISPTILTEKGKHNRAVPLDLEATLNSRFKYYKQYYKNL